MEARAEDGDAARRAAIEAEEAALDDVLLRASRILEGEGGGFSAAEAPLSAALRAAGKWYGKKADGAPFPGERPEESVERMARGAGLLAHGVSLAPGWAKRYALPMIALRRADGVAVALTPCGSGWKITEGDRAHAPRRLDAAALAALSDEAWALTPALPDGKVTLKGLFWHAFPTTIRDLSAFALMTFIAGLVLALTPIANLAVTQFIIPGRDGGLLVHVGVMLIALVLAAMATRLAAELSTLRVNGRTGLMLRAAAADRMIRVTRAAAHGAAIPPAAAALVTRCVEGWRRGAWGLAIGLASAWLIALPSLTVMVSVAPGAALAAFAVIVAATGVAAWTAKAQIAALFSGPTSPTSWISLSHEALSQIETLRAHGAERRFFSLFASSFLALKEKFLVTDRMGSRIHALEKSLEALVVAAGVGAALLLHGDMAPQSSVAFTIALMTVTGAAVTLVHGFLDVSMLGLQHRMIQPLIEGAPAAGLGGERPPALTGALAAEEITVSRDKHARPILDRVTLRAEPGERIAIVGPSGSGKSTLLRALLGLEALAGGRVSYDGLGLDRLDAAAVRRQIGVVGQSGQLFPGTLLENVALGRPMTDAQVWEALRLAAIDDEVRALPLGLSTPIGDAGSVFSGGQAQRLMIARALAQRPRIVILDEATSALDPDREARVAAALASLKATAITVAHRLDTIRHCDRIYVLEAGRIVEAGPWAALAAADGPFARLLAAEARAR